MMKKFFSRNKEYIKHFVRDNWKIEKYRLVYNGYELSLTGGIVHFAVVEKYSNKMVARFESECGLFSKKVRDRVIKWYDDDEN